MTRQKRKIRVVIVDYEDQKKIVHVHKTIFETNYGFMVKTVAWRVLDSDFRVDPRPVLNACQRGDIVLLHFGKYFPVKAARKVVAALRRKGAKTIAFTAGRPEIYRTDGVIQKPMDPADMAHIIRLVSKKR